MSAPTRVARRQACGAVATTKRYSAPESGVNRPLPIGVGNCNGYTAPFSPANSVTQRAQSSSRGSLRSTVLRPPEARCCGATNSFKTGGINTTVQGAEHRNCGFNTKFLVVPHSTGLPVAASFNSKFSDFLSRLKEASKSAQIRRAGIQPTRLVRGAA